MLFPVLRSLRHLPYRALTAAGVLFFVAWAAGHVARLALLSERAWLAGTAFTTVIVAVWAVRWLAPALSTGRWVGRRDDASQHAGGVSTWTDVGQRSSDRALRARAVQLRPSLRTASRRFRRRVATTAYGVPLVKTSWAPGPSTVWSSCEEVTLRIGGPRSGKSASLACHALDAPGSLLVTTSRTDLLEQTGAARAEVGAVHVFNPTGLGGTPSTVRWTPLTGCEDYGTAQRRADDLIPPARSADAERWDVQARSLLTTLLHAAALSGGSMRTILGWISPADAIARDEILDALKGAREGTDTRPMLTQIRSLYSTNDRTLSSITTTLLPHLKWVNDRTIAAVADAALDDPLLLDVAAFVASGRDSLYLIGRDGGAPTLIGALTAEVAHQVRMHAGRMPGGRLDPPMTALLDEAPLTCGPIPLHDWSADMGGRNFTLHIAAQSLAQLRDVWGHDRAAAILGNTGTLMVFGGIKSADDLQEISTLCGTRLVAVDADDNRPLPVMTPAEISVLEPGTALVLRNAMRPIIGRAPMIWDRGPSRLRLAVERLLAAIDRTAARLKATAGKPRVPRTVRSGFGAAGSVSTTSDTGTARRAGGRPAGKPRLRLVGHDVQLPPLTVVPLPDLPVDDVADEVDGPADGTTGGATGDPTGGVR